MGGTLVNGLLARSGFQRVATDPRDPDGQLRPGIVHRIDRNTSGLLVVAKTELAREHLKDQLASHSMERSYVALTVGVPRLGRIETLHGRDPKNRLRFSSQVTEGKRAVTHVSVLETFGRARAAWVECRLETGRTHQIRVHLSAEARTPLIGDELYGGLQGAPEVVLVGRNLGRQALHAKTLGFIHPVTGEGMRFSVEVPADMELAHAALRELAPG
jgi:23S rRNA pseudouridine1911/1915/1917 synthase